MTSSGLASLLEYYQREIAYLRTSSVNFAAQYPKIARRLQLGAGESSDPHIERLLEAFAFLSARLQRDIEDQFPRVTSALLSVLYPQLAQPVPPIAIAQFQVDPNKGKLTSGYTIAAKTPLFTQSQDDQTCRFSTCYPITLWPIQIYEAELLPTNLYDFATPFTSAAKLLRLKLKCLSGNFKDLSLKDLRIYLNGSQMEANRLYQSIFSGEGSIALVNPSATSIQGSTKIIKNSLHPVGFKLEDEVIPYPPNAHPAYRIIQEYFICPQKFHFFDLTNLDLFESENELHILIPLVENDKLTHINLTPQLFQLGCTPIINLFKKISEPIRLTHRQLEYRLVADQRREATTEIHSLLKVSQTTDEKYESQFIAPYFSYDHEAALTNQNLFWYARRVLTERVDLPGTDIYLSFVDYDFNPKLPPANTLYAHLLCTNRQLATQIPAGGILHVEEALPAAQIICLTPPTAPYYPAAEGATQWQLISQLSLNQLSLSNGSQSLEALKEILRLYINEEHHTTSSEVEGLKKMSVASVVRRFGNEAWRGFAKGTSIHLTLDEGAYEDVSPFLFANILHHFLSLYASINSFVELTLLSTSREGVWKTWPPIAGEQQLL